MKDTQRRAAPAALAVLALVAAACGAVPGAGGVRVLDAWTRPADVGDTVGLYFAMENLGDTPDRLLGATTSAAGAIELHESMIEGDVVHMMPVSGIDLPAGGTIELRPGGLHAMLVGLTEALEVGDQVSLTLLFERAGAVEIGVDVVEP